MRFDVLCMACADLIIPVIMVLFGYHLTTHTPEKGKLLFAYRSRRAQVNEDTWQFANQYFGRCLVVEGIILSAIAVVMAMSGTELESEIVRLVAILVATGEICAVIAAAIPTETALKNTFDENGYRR
ncbi:MAG: SdpI family protein [Bulleidia sp.]